MNTSSADFDPYSVRLGKLFFEEIIEIRDKLHVGVSFDGPILVSHENVTDSHLYERFLDQYPHWKRFRAKACQRKIDSVSFPRDVEASPIYKIIDMDVDVNGKWKYLVEVDAVQWSPKDIQRINLVERVANFCKENDN